MLFTIIGNMCSANLWDWSLHFTHRRLTNAMHDAKYENLHATCVNCHK